MKTRSWVALAGLLGILGGMSVSAGPRAKPTTTSWTLDFSFHDPQRITLTLPGDRHETTFWYMLFDVGNETGRDVAYYPTFRLVTDTLQVVEGGGAISPSVYDAICARHRKEYPFLVVPSKITGPLLQGRDNARASVAVFRQFDPIANSFTIFVGGLSGEIVRVANPSFDATQEASDANPRFFILRRTLALRYDIPGDPDTRKLAKPIRRSRDWVMR